LPELIAHHLDRAGRREEAVRFWQLAGDRAAAHREALSHYEWGLAALAETPASAQRAQLELILQLSQGASCAAVYGYADQRSERAYTRAAELAAAAPDATVPLPALWGIWAAYLVRGTHTRGLDLVQRCLTLADAANSAELRAVAGAISGTPYVYAGRWQDAQRELELAAKATGPATQLFPIDPALASRALLAVVHAVRGNGSEAEAELALALSGAAAMTGRQAEFTRAYVFCFAAWFAQLADDSARALGFAQQAIAIAKRNNFETWLGAGALHVAGALTELGDFDTGLPLFAQALAGWRGAGSELMVPYFLGRYGRALVRAGKLDDGLAALREALALSLKDGEAFYLAELHRLIAEALASAGAEPSTVAAELDSGVRVAVEQGATVFGARLEAVRAARRASS
jgi:predicted ATPase